MGCGFWSDGYSIGTVRGRGDRKIIENYIKIKVRRVYQNNLSCLMLQTNKAQCSWHRGV